MSLNNKIGKRQIAKPFLSSCNDLIWNKKKSMSLTYQYIQSILISENWQYNKSFFPHGHLSNCLCNICIRRGKHTSISSLWKYQELVNISQRLIDSYSECEGGYLSSLKFFYFLYWLYYHCSCRVSVLDNESLSEL